MKAKLILGLVFIVNLAFSQDRKPVLGADFNKYVAEMEAYYANRDKGRGSGYKQYMRWHHEMATKVGVSGLIKNFEALNQTAYDKSKVIFSKNTKVQATHGLWEDLGPSDYYSSDAASNSSLCRTTCIAFHPTNANILWVGTPVGGLWKTTDHGGSWNCITNDFASIGISDVVVNQTNPNIIYVLTGDGDSGQTSSIGVMKTIDGGLTWKNTGLNFTPDQNKNPFSLKMNPVNPDILIAVFRQNVYRTSNAGDTWIPVVTISDITDPIEEWAWDLEYKPGDPSIVYLVCSLGILKSIDGGLSFSPSNSGFPTDPSHPTNPKNWDRLSVSVSAATPNVVYVLASGVPGSGIFSGLFKSTDSGATWIRMSNSPNILGYDNGGNDAKGQTGYNVSMDVNPGNANQVFVGSINCWKSDVSGATGTWSRETNYNRTFGAVDPFVHADWHNIKFKGARLYACTDGGVYFTDDFGNSWSDISSGLGATQFYNIDILGANYIGGTQDNGTNEGTIGNPQMHNIEAGDGFGAIWHKTNSNIKFITTQNSITRRQDGNNWTLISGDGQFWNCTLKNATNTNQIFFGIQDKTKLIRANPINDVTINMYSFYNCNNSTLGSGQLMGYSQGTNNPSVMYVAHFYNILKTTDIYNATPSSWTVLPQPSTGITYDDIIVDPANSQRVWVVCNAYVAGKKVYKSIDGGNTWENISGTLPNVPILTIELVETGGDKLYIGTSIGIFYRSSIMADWVYYSNALPNVKVEDIKLTSTHIYAGTFGRGIWRSELYSSCPPTLALTPANETVTNIFAPGTQVHSAGVSLTSTRQYTGSVGTNINYNATNFIDLKEGFEIKKDGYLEVKNKGCPD